VTSHLAAIISRYQVATAITASGPFMELAADEATLPYGVYQVLGVKHLPNYGTDYHSEFTIRFILTDDNFADVVTAQTALHTRFDKHRLAVNGCTPMLRINSYANPFGVEENGLKVYRTVSDYRFLARQAY
jgi:hypothetical protein